MSEEKDYVVVKDGQRVSGLVDEGEANKKADALRQKVNENANQGGKPSKVEVKRNLFG